MTVHRLAHGLQRGLGFQGMKMSSLMVACDMAFRRNLKSGFLPRFLFALAALALLSVTSNTRALAGYPDRIIKIVVPFAPGGGTDVVARTLAQEMAQNLGVNVMIENKPGAGTIIGTQAVAVSDADGYTLLMGTFANAVNPSLNARLPYDPHQDFAAVALVARSFNVVVVNPKSPIQSIADLIAAAKAEPDKLSYGTFGIGTSAHLAGELFKTMAKVNLATIHYKGAAPAITDLIGGQIQVMFTTVASAASLIESGQLRALAVTSSERSPAFPQLPTVAEAGVPGYAAESWYGLFAPAKTPPEAIDRLNRSAASAVQSEAFNRLGVNEGLVMIARPPAELDRYFRAEEARWHQLIRDAGIKVE
jgi:tripartite-type tricarboxylate transporter receptor subunit TctC